MKRRLAARAKAWKKEQRTASSPPGVIGVPCVAWMWTEAVHALMALRYPPGSFLYMETDSSTIAAKRNELVRKLLEKPEFKWILFLDSDMTPPPDTIVKLLATHRDIVSALCVKRKPPYCPCVSLEHPVPETVLSPSGVGTTPLSQYGGPDPVKEVDLTGTGCLLVHRRVFESMEPPWFEASPEGDGEDYAFCRKARAAGFKIFCDTNQWVAVGMLTSR